MMHFTRVAGFALLIGLVTACQDSPSQQTLADARLPGPAGTDSGEGVATAKPLGVPQVENEAVFADFNREAIRLPQLLRTFRFRQQSEPLGAEYRGTKQDRVVTYTHAGDTVQYYVGPGQRMLLYCALHHAARYSRQFAFAARDKRTLVPADLQFQSAIMITDRAGFEDLRLTFAGNAIETLTYTSHPD